MIQREKHWKSHLCFNIVDVRREAEDNLGVVCIVFAVFNSDGHINLVFVFFDHHSGEENENCQHTWL